MDKSSVRILKSYQTFAPQNIFKLPCQMGFSDEPSLSNICKGRDSMMGWAIGSIVWPLSYALPSNNLSVQTKLRDSGCPSNSLVSFILERSRILTEAANRLAQHICHINDQLYAATLELFQTTSSGTEFC